MLCIRKRVSKQDRKISLPEIVAMVHDKYMFIYIMYISDINVLFKPFHFYVNSLLLAILIYTRVTMLG